MYQICFKVDVTIILIRMHIQLRWGGLVEQKLMNYFCEKLMK
jgi:hypothetical protein